MLPRALQCHLKLLRTYSVDGIAEGDETERVVEDAAAVEDGRREAHQALEPLLKAAQPRTLGVVRLTEEIVFPK